MQFTIRSISEHNSSLGRIVERHWSMFVRGLYLVVFSASDDNFCKSEVGEINHHHLDLKAYLSLHAGFERIEKHLDRLHSQFNCLFRHLSMRPMLNAMVNFVGFKRMEDYGSTEEWVGLLREYWPISDLDVKIQNRVKKVLQEINP